MTGWDQITETTAAAPLTPEQATRDAVIALKEAGFGKEHGRPAAVESWSLGRENFGIGPELIRSGVTVKRSADVDAAIRALLVLPGVVSYALKGTAMSVHRIAQPEENAP